MTCLLISLLCRRHRLMLLFTLSGILRMESLNSAFLSDLFLIKGINEEKESQMWDCLIMQMLDGKTNRGMMFYGRSMRHRNVLLCAIGALAFYLMARFKLTGEFEGEKCPDFTNNRTWYNIKLLLAIGTSKKKKNANAATGRGEGEVSKCNFKTAIKKILMKLGIASSHFEHLGRIFGHMNLQFLEIDEKFIQKLGNWNVDVRDQCYSNNLPLPAMRGAAGYTQNNGRYSNPRATVDPPEELERMIFPFAEAQLEKVQAEVERNGARLGGNYLGAARNFLNMLLRLRTIVLQDAAALQVEHPERCNGHMLFLAFPEIFRSQLFIVSSFCLIVKFFSLFSNLFA